LLTGESASCSVKVLLERLPEDVLIRAALGSPQRAETHIGHVIDLERQGDRLLAARIASLLRPSRSRTGTAGLGLVSHVISNKPIVHAFT
jgi:hypothetical protein